MGGSRSDRRCGDRRTAGARGRAAAPAKRRDGHTHETNCLNCGAALDRPLLPRMRAEGARPPHACAPSCTTSLHGVLHFEGKIWRTLPMLAWRPGELTRRYIDGERARFVSPIALFLFSRLPDVRGAQPDRRLDSWNATRRKQSDAQPSRDRRATRPKLAKLEAQRAKADRRQRQRSTANIDRKIASRKLKRFQREGVLERGPSRRAPINVDDEHRPAGSATSSRRRQENPRAGVYKLQDQRLQIQLGC